MKTLARRILSHRWGKKGQSTAEYIIIVALVAIGSIAIITIFGNQIRSLFTTSSRQLGGNTTADVGQGDAAANQNTDISSF